MHEGVPCAKRSKHEHQHVENGADRHPKGLLVYQFCLFPDPVHRIAPGDVLQDPAGCPAESSAHSVCEDLSPEPVAVVGRVLPQICPRFKAFQNIGISSRACIDLIDGKDELALLSVEAALKVQPDMADAYLVLTQVYAGQGDVDKAIENLETYIDLTEDTELYETVAQLHEAKGDYESAVAAYDKYVAGAGAEVEEAGFQSGLYRMESGKYESAIEAFTPYKESELYGAGALYNIGICQMSLGDYAAARESLTACEEKGGGFDGLYYNRGICALMAEEWESAAADFEKSIESEPYKTDAAYNLGICQMQAEAYEEAISSFTGLIDNAGEEGVNDSVYYYRAICLTAVGKLEEALADYTTCIEHEYELAQSYYQRSQVYASLGDAEKQTADLEASLKYAG